MAVRLAFCGLDEVEALTGFLRDHWGRDHVLVTDRRVLDWQHRDEQQDRYTFLMARDGDEVVGVLGYIPTSRYDPALAGDRDTLWLTTWRARDDAPPGTGLALVRGIERLVPHGWVGTVGLRASAEPLYRGLGFRVGVLEQWVMADPDRGPGTLRMADGGPVPVAALGPVPDRHDGTRLAPLDPAALADPDLERLLAPTDLMPTWTATQVAARFLANPLLRYDVHLARRGDRGALVVSRVVDHGDARVLRIVGVMGRPDALVGAGPALLDLLRDRGADHLELHIAGAGDVLEAAGMHRVTAVPGLVVPSRYDPFEDRPVSLRYAMRGPDGPLLITRADADQDRPNRPRAAIPSA